MRKLLGVMFVLFFVVVLSGVLKGDEGFSVVKRDLSIADKPVYVEDELLVVFEKEARRELEEQFINKFGFIKKERELYPELFTLFNTSKSGKEIRCLMEEIKSIPGVICVERNAYVYAFGVPNDPLYSYQWHMKRINMEYVWDHADGEGVTVAVLDSGVKQTLPDLASTTFVEGWDFINNDNDPTDDHSHGSHVAGTIAQSTNNGIGVAGVAYKAKIMPIKVLDASGSGNMAITALGIKWAVDHGADVINLSLGGKYPAQVLLNEINNAWNNGVVIVCAAGNNNVSTPFYPAAYPNCISVSATDYNDNRAPYSNYGSTIDITAPGGDYTVDLNGDSYGDGILQQTINNGQPAYLFYQGTSMACPHVAGVAAIMKSINPALTNAEIRTKLYSSATDIGVPGKDDKFGWGLLNAEEAIKSIDYMYVKSFTYTKTPMGNGKYKVRLCISVRDSRHNPLPGVYIGFTWFAKPWGFSSGITTGADGNAYYERIVSSAVFEKVQIVQIGKTGYVQYQRGFWDSIFVSVP